MGEVISIGKLNEEQIATLESAGVEVLESVDLGELDLQELGSGERFLFHLEPEDTAIFVEMYRLHVRIEKWEREITGKMLIKTGNIIADSRPGQDLSQEFRDSNVASAFDNEEDEHEYWRLCKRKAFLHSLLWWRLGERGKCHHWHMDVRLPAYGDKQLRCVKIKPRKQEFTEERS